jgi:hypothetical protein
MDWELVALSGPGTRPSSPQDSEGAISWTPPPCLDVPYSSWRTSRSLHLRSLRPFDEPARPYSAPIPSERPYCSPAALPSPLQFSIWALATMTASHCFLSSGCAASPSWSIADIQNPRARMTYHLSRSRRAQTLWWTRLGSFLIERRTSKTPVGPRQPHDQGHVRVDGKDRQFAGSPLDLSTRPLVIEPTGTRTWTPWQSSRWGSVKCKLDRNHVGSGTSVICVDCGAA